MTYRILSDHEFDQIWNDSIPPGAREPPTLASPGGSTIYDGFYAGERVAIKVFFPQQTSLEMVTREAASLSRCRHPHVVPIIGACGPSNRRLFMIFPRLQPLRWRTPQHQVEYYLLSQHEILSVCSHVCAGIAHMHDEANCAHCDLAPKQLLLQISVGAAGQAARRCTGFVADLGAAAGGDSIAATGTTNYVAPEVVAASQPGAPQRGRLSVDAFKQADIFSLGCTLINMLCAREHESHAELVHMLEHSGEVPQSLVPLLRNMIAPDPLARPSARHARAAFERELSSASSSSSSASSPRTPGTPGGGSRFRHRDPNNSNNLPDWIVDLPTNDDQVIAWIFDNGFDSLESFLITTDEELKDLPLVLRRRIRNLITEVQNNNNQNNQNQNHNSPRNGVFISLRGMTGQVVTVRVDINSTTVREIKQMCVQQLDGVQHPSEVHLFFAGCDMDDARTLAEYDVSADSTLNVVVRHGNANQSSSSSSAAGGGAQAQPTSTTPASPAKTPPVTFAPDADLALGIDLGTSACRCCIFTDGVRVSVVLNELAFSSTAACVSFLPHTAGEREHVVGDEARNLSARNAAATIFSVLRRVDDTREALQVGQHRIFPRQLLAMVLGKVKADAEAFVAAHTTAAAASSSPRHINRCTLSVPCGFSLAQRWALSDACAIAGLELMRLVSAPSALGLAYSLVRNLSTRGPRLGLFVDFGAGGLDMGVVEIDDGIVEIKSVSGSEQTGGDDLDRRILNYCVDEFESRNRGANVRGDASAMRRLLTHAERAKIALSSATSAEINISPLVDGIDFQITISRGLFEELCDDLFQRAIPIVERLLREAGKNKNEVQFLVLAGGSTRIPRFQRLLTDFFHRTDRAAEFIDRSLSPWLGVASGCAVEAAMLNGDHSHFIDNLLLIEASYPHAIGIETDGGAMTPIIARNRALPTIKSRILTTTADKQSRIVVPIREGDRALAKDCNLIGIIEVDVPPLARGVARVLLELDIDANYMIGVSATVDPAPGDTQKTKKQMTLSSINFGERLSQRLLSNQRAQEVEAQRLAQREALARRIEGAQRVLGVVVEEEAGGGASA